MTERRLGMWFEDLAEGMVVRHAVTRTLTETDNVLFTTMSMNPQPLHLDVEFAAGTVFKRPTVNSLFTLALVVGLSVPELTLGTTVANLGFEKVNFPNAAFVGDTIHASTEVLALRASSSRPDVGIVRFRHNAFNQHDQLVCEAHRVAMMLRRPTQPDD